MLPVFCQLKHELARLMRVAEAAHVLIGKCLTVGLLGTMLVWKPVKCTATAKECSLNSRAGGSNSIGRCCCGARCEPHFSKQGGCNILVLSILYI
eukprot:1159087-Pelagomonas_calceolata.AAC.8